MQLAKKVHLSLWEKLDLLPALASIWVTVFYALLTGLWRTERQAKSLLLHVGYAVMRRLTRRMSPKQLQYVSPPTNKVYEIYMKKTKQLAQSVDIGENAIGHWIGDRKADHVLIWYHGGGFSLPANMGYFKFFTQLIASAAAENKSLAIFGLTYTLAPEATYPTQIRQAVEALRYVLNDSRNHTPSQIFLGGDSAGGNLVGGVLSHLAHPHPDIEPVVLSENLAGAVLLSPWTSMDTDFSDQQIYSGGDLITEYVAAPWSGAYLGAATRDYYTDLSLAPADWYNDFPVESVLVCAGGNEIMLPIIGEFVEKFQAGHSSVEYFVGDRECHVAPVYNLYLGSKTETEQGKKVKTWLRELL